MPDSISMLPSGACPSCGTPANYPEMIGTACTQQTGGRRCTGKYRATMAASDWMICSECQGAGRVHERHCQHCEGLGLRYARPQFP
ncbi:MAG: hypothetical protein JWN94_3654 [Betaproteobacteria bacterium]|nr:hypothetical protein [Betaproteobacteria bacterium]